MASPLEPENSKYWPSCVNRKASAELAVGRSNFIFKINIWCILSAFSSTRGVDAKRLKCLLLQLASAQDIVDVSNSLGCSGFRQALHTFLLKSDPQCHPSNHLTQLLWGTFWYPLDSLENTVQGLGTSEGNLELASSLHFTAAFGQEMSASCSEITVISVKRKQRYCKSKTSKQ